MLVPNALQSSSPWCEAAGGSSLDKGRDTHSVISRRLFSHCAVQARSCSWPWSGAATRWASGLRSYFPFGLSLPFIRREFKEGQTSLPGDFMWAVEAATCQSPGWHLSFLSAQMKPVFLLCVRGLMVKPFVLTLSFHFCLFAAPQFPASAFNPPGTCLIFSSDHQREKQRMQNTPNRDILMRGGSTARHECSFKVTKS